MDRAHVLTVYQALVDAFDGVQIKGAKSKYTSVNGNMFSFLDPDGVLCFRLSEARKKEFNAEYGQGDVIQYGAVMRGYVAVPAAILNDTEGLHRLFREVVAHANSLKPKPTKKPKPKS